MIDEQAEQSELLYYHPHVIEDFLRDNPRPKSDHDAIGDANFANLSDAPFMATYYSLVNRLKIRPPTYDELWDSYIARYRFVIDRETRRLRIDQEAVRQRIVRNYASMISEHYAICLFGAAVRGRRIDGAFNRQHDDLRHGIDLIIWLQRPRYLAIDVYYESGGSSKWHDEKHRRRALREPCRAWHPIPLDQVEMYCLKIDREQASLIGNVYLISPNQVDDVLSKMHDLDLFKNEAKT